MPFAFHQTRRLCWYILALTWLLKPVHAQVLTLQPGDHICLIGNALGERMQHQNYFETWLYEHFPDYQLVVRNLCFPGDEPALRRRVKGFGTPDEHLAHSQADVILCFFGLNESFRGEPGRASFVKELKDAVQQMAQQRYNGKSAPRVVLISAIAMQNTHDPDLPDGRAENQMLEKYVADMQQVAQQTHTGFVDLFHPTLQMFAATEDRLTINAIHLNERGYEQLAPLLGAALFSQADSTSAVHSEKLRQAIADKNFHWWHRYRAVNGFSIYGDRGLAGNDGTHNNRDVMERERAILDQMCATRDRRIWDIAQGKSVSDQIDDSGTLQMIEPDPIASANEAETGTSDPQAIKYLTASEQLQTFQLPEGFIIELVASEEMFPELAKPVAINFDDQGRLWVAVMPSYPQWRPKTKLDDKLLILEDLNGDGRADRCHTFAGGLHVPTGFELGHGGVYVACQPDILFLRDLDGDDVADERVRRVVGFCTADTHHGLGSLEWGPDGGLYCMEGVFKRSTIETPYGPQRSTDSAVWTWNPRTEAARVFSSFPLTNAWGLVFDSWGQGFVANGTSSLHYWLSPISGRMTFPATHAWSWKDDEGQDHEYPQIVPHHSRPCSATELVSSRNFPDAMQGGYLVNNVIGVLGTMQYSLADHGAGYQGQYQRNLVESSDRNFRPSDLQFGPDGALYICDWHNALIGHLQHNLRDPNRDHTHGRIWRVRYAERPLNQPMDLRHFDAAGLLRLLNEPELRTRYRVRRALAAMPTADVMPALQTFVADSRAKHDEPLLLEALWLHQAHHDMNLQLLNELLDADDFRVRAAATRVVADWSARLSDPLSMLKARVSDPHPRVRLEAVRACSFIDAPEALDTALEVLNYPMDDPYLSYTLEQTLHTLQEN